MPVWQDCVLCVFLCALCGKERKSNVAVFTNGQKVIPTVRINQKIYRQVAMQNAKSAKRNRLFPDAFNKD